MSLLEEKSTNLNKLTRLDFYYRADFTRLIQELRTNRGGSLSGMTLDEIVSQITILVHDYERQQGRSPSVAATQPQVSTLRNYEKEVNTIKNHREGILDYIYSVYRYYLMGRNSYNILDPTIFHVHAMEGLIAKIHVILLKKDIQ